MKTIDFKAVAQNLVDYCRQLLEEFISTGEEEEQPVSGITGTWIATGKTYASRWVFRKSGTVERYYKNDLYKVYYWSIRDVSDPSDSRLRELVLANKNNPDIEIDFQISVLTGDQLILVYEAGIEESQHVYDRYK